ncbi:PQQ-dependent sugar dehydrogenase, partial [Singulisphaera rosea]
MWSLRVLVFIVLLGPAVSAAERPGDEKPFGLDRRIPWNDSRVVGSPDPLSPYKVVRAFPNLKVKQPLGLFPEPGTNRLFLLRHENTWAGPGQVLVLDDSQDASKTELLVEVDGLAVGLTFHPKYVENGYIYIGLNGPIRGWKKTSQAVRFTVDRKTGKVDPKTRKLIIEWPSNGHNGDDLDFGNDGYLYVSAGDGSSDSDADLTGQTLNDLTGSVIRIDVDHPENGKEYGIPKDNPFVDRPGARGELWAYGLRNPWKLSYDHPSGQLWVGNNGQDLWEQVFLIQKGGNYGWSVTEGSHIFHALRKPGPDPILLPAAEHSHSEARSLTGG